MGSGMSSSMALALAGFCFSVLFIVFVCTRLACALLRRRGARSHRAAPALPQHYAHDYYADPDPFPFHVARHHHHHAAAEASPGLDPAAVAAFPARAYNAAARSSPEDDDDSQCIICLSEYEEKDMLRILPYCSHNFHMACIDLWLEQNSTCPVCRISLLVLDDPGSEHTAPPPPPPPPLSSIVISPPSSPESSRSDPCRCLFVSSGHSSRASEAPPRHEPDQENQVVSGPSVDDGANSLPLSEVNPPPENNSQTVRKQVDRSTQLGPCK
ncbi:RING-H2 finger protein ATL80-like [Miscanthus floridulus]|uniref:RING-H2 finger protein ATL80-like n=1 Tax=Miscanthus floridulus TaxID=154761 RepID=UPI003457A54D